MRYKKYQPSVVALVLFNLLVVSMQPAKIFSQEKLASSSMENIALHRPYTMTPAPNYEGCTDKDAIQLTDGVYSKSDEPVSSIWAMKSTVGWVGASGVGTSVMVSVDLGKVQPIAGLSYSTAAKRTSSVFWPQRVLMMVSNDNQTWYFVGDLVSLSNKKSLPPVDNGTHRYVTQDLQTQGRYVTMMIVGSPYIFCDEIEVYRGPEMLLSKELSGKSVQGMDGIRKFETDQR